MLTTYTLNIAGQTIFALGLNPADTPGQPVILLHGIGGSVGFWSSDQTQAFLKQGPCYALSLPGHYPAAFPPGFCQEQVTTEMISTVLANAVCELVGNRPVTLVGMSTGGFAALAMAAFRPEMVERVICVSGFCQGRWIGVLGGYQWLARRGRLGRMIFKLLYSSPRISPAAFNLAWRVYAADVKAMYTYPHFRACTDAGYANYQRLNLDSVIPYFAVMPDIDICDALKHIRAPVLVLAGDCDPIVPPAQAHLISRLIPQAELVMIPGGGHILFAERPLEYQAALSAWLSKFEPG